MDAEDVATRKREKDTGEGEGGPSSPSFFWRPAFGRSAQGGEVMDGIQVSVSPVAPVVLYL